MSAATLTESRHEGLGHRHGAKHVHLELATHLLDRRFLEDAFVAITRIVHEDIDGTET